MISIPPKIIVESISDFCIFFFKDRNHQPDAPPHFHVVFPINPESGLVVTIITSQVDSRQQYYRRTSKDALDSLVCIDNDIFPFLNRNSIADCNSTELLTKFELVTRIDQSAPYEIKLRALPSFIKKDICAAIRKSPLVSPRLKRMIKDVLKSL